MYAQLLLHFQADPFETLHTHLGWPEDTHIFFFQNPEIILLLLFMFVFSPYTTEVHREYVPVAGHGAWLAVLFIYSFFYFFYFFFIFFFF